MISTLTYTLDSQVSVSFSPWSPFLSTLSLSILGHPTPGSFWILSLVQSCRLRSWNGFWCLQTRRPNDSERMWCLPGPLPVPPSESQQSCPRHNSPTPRTAGQKASLEEQPLMQLFIPPGLLDSKAQGYNPAPNRPCLTLPPEASSFNNPSLFLLLIFFYL